MNFDLAAFLRHGPNPFQWLKIKHFVGFVIFAALMVAYIALCIHVTSPLGWVLVTFWLWFAVLIGAMFSKHDL